MPPSPHHPDDLDLARRILLAESHAVAQLADHLGPDFSHAVDLIAACATKQGTVLVSGLGKSGLIGSKIAATLTSLGIASHYVHPAEAVHGDLGRFRSCDLCIALSYSGETEEVVALAGLLKQDGIPVIAITAGTRNSGLQRACTVSLAIGDCEDDLSPAPMASTTAQLALGDALALCASRRLAFSPEDFAKRHPGGALGALLLPVTDALRFRTADGTLKPVADDLSVAEALKLSETSVRRPGALLLVDRSSGQLTGLFTDADLRRLVLKNPAGMSDRVSAHMTKNPGTLDASSLVRDAVRMVREHRRDEIPIVDAQHRPVGLLDVQDLIAMKLVRD